MKKILFAALGLATIAATAASAQTTKDHVRTHVQRPAYVVNGSYTTNDPYLVIENDRVIGRDPDANVRSQMRHDPVQNEY